MIRTSFRFAAGGAAAGILLVAAAGIDFSAAQSPSIPYFIADGTGLKGVHSSDPDLARWALEAWRRSAPGQLRFEPADEASALIRLYWVEPNSGRYGEAHPFSVNGRLGADVFVQADVTVLDEEIARRASGDVLLRDSIVYLTCLHEIGHALGLAHTKDFPDIMYYFGYGGDVTEYFGRYRAQLRSRADIATVSGLSEADVTRLKAILLSR